jgi:hypothetical protein
MEDATVIVEATFGNCLTNAPSWGKRTSEDNCKYLHSTAIAWMREFPGVPWVFCDDRRMAEVTAFRILEQFWARHARERRQQTRKSVLKTRQTQPLFQE